MPRSGISGLATQPPGLTPQQPNTPILSATWNAGMNDIYQIFNTEQPVNMGGTGGASETEARENLDILSKSRMGFPSAGGTANARTLSPVDPVASYTDGLLMTFRVPSANTGPATLNVSAVGVKPIRRIVENLTSPLVAGDLQANGRYMVVYDPSADSGNGAWIMVGDMPYTTSNSNGFYRLFPDGVLECWREDFPTQSTTVAAGPLYSSTSATWTFPKSFSSTTGLVVTGSVDGLTRWVVTAAPTTASVAYAQMSTVSSGITVKARLHAIGRWY